MPLDVNSSVFNHVAYVVLSVPKGTKEDYELAGFWQDFGVIREEGAFFNDGDLEYTIIDSDNNYVSVAKYETNLIDVLIIPETVNKEDIIYTITSISDHAFIYCSSLTSVIIPESVISIGVSAFGECSSLTNVFIPESVISIDYYAFEECSSLLSVSIPEGVTSIESSTFTGCSSLLGVSIPEGVTSIGSFAFSGCSSITNVVLNWKIPLAINLNVFRNVIFGSIVLTVPKGTKEDYELAGVWKEFKSITEADIN
ncbi:leucine-rich repeat domain-containing protein [Flavicella sp.]|uniref:leucine-rich repeat domain-containing protein n=1 Tax=Flavicella sp. TaxID=2957742 RepID=UPI0030169DFD